MFQPRTALRAAVATVVFAAERVRMGILAIAAILMVKIVGAMWLPTEPAAGPTASAGPVATAPIR